MSESQKENALRKVLEERPDSKDDFLFLFQCLHDMETFLSSCADEQGLKVNAMFVSS